MSVNTKEIFVRMDLQQIRNFIFEGIDAFEKYNITYNQRLQESTAPMIKRLELLYKDDENELSDAAEEFYNALTVHTQRSLR